MQRLLISSPDLRINAAIRSKQGQTVHQFLISGPDLAIAAAMGCIPGTSVQRFLILGGQFNNRCNNGVHSGHFRAAILDFKPKLANRCSKEVKTRAIRASIPDFRPRIDNRCSAEVKTGVNPAAQGRTHCAAAGECRMGRDFGRRSRPWLREEGPAAQRWEGKHRRCAPVRSPCPQAEPATETAQTPQADSVAETAPARRQTRTRKPSAPGKKRVPTHR